LPVEIAKTAASVCAVLTTFSGRLPFTLREQMLVLGAFVLMDAACRLWLAARAPKARRRAQFPLTLSRLGAKLLQYLLFLTLSAGAALLAHTWLPLHSAFLGLIGIETLSLLEILALLEQNGGVNMGPLRPLLRSVSRYLVTGLDKSAEDSAALPTVPDTSEESKQ
jgi:hypothetical protein